ncbi:MAG: hypothetical protein DDT40_01479 [candidate division WS2 bacterium]|nr:hypothetical protein [Candidatus Psychracetigena formicireducens]
MLKKMGLSGVCLVFLFGSFLVGKAVADSRNLLRNSSFQIAGNPGFPDHWKGQSGWRPGTHELVEEGYIPGTKSMKLSNLDGRATSFLSGNWGWSPGKAGTKYTLSVYLKSEPSGLVAKIGGRIGEKEVEVDSTWKRYTHTGSLGEVAHAYFARLLSIGITLAAEKKGVLYVNAPMLVRGEQAGEYHCPDLAKGKKQKRENLSPLNEALLGEWVFEESSEKDEEGRIVIKDRSGKGNDGVIVGNPSWVTTKFGSVLRFDGETYVLVPYSPTLENKSEEEISLEIVLQPDTAKDMPILIRGMHWGGYALRIIVGSYRPIISAWNFAPGAMVIPVATHIIITFKKPDVRFYLDGELTNEGEIDVSLNPRAEKRPLVIGGWDGWTEERGGYHPEPGFEGWIRLVRIYERALTEDEVRAQYQKLLQK